MTCKRDANATERGPSYLEIASGAEAKVYNGCSWQSTISLGKRPRVLSQSAARPRRHKYPRGGGGRPGSVIERGERFALSFGSPGPKYLDWGVIGGYFAPPNASGVISHPPNAWGVISHPPNALENTIFATCKQGWPCSRPTLPHAPSIEACGGISSRHTFKECMYF